MVSDKEIRASNALINDATAPRVAVFIGGTSGIGKFTVRALADTGASTRIYLVGRKSSAERMNLFMQELHAVNPKVEFNWIEAEVALLSETKRVCEVIKSRESRVDLLFLTTGYAPFGPRKETAEGIEIAQSLEHYSRILSILHLLPLLSAAEAPKVVSVLAGGLEQATIDLEDLDLKKPGNFSGMKAQVQYAVMHTATLDKLATDNPDVTFIHSWPGWVSTGNVRRSSDPNSSSIWTWFVRLILDPFIRLIGIRDEVSGQRHLFQSTSAAFGGRGVPWNGKPGINSRGEPADGLFLVNYKCDCTPNQKVMPLLREKAQDKIWDHTQEVLRPYL